MKNNKNTFFALIAKSTPKGENWKVVKDFKITKENISERKVIIFNNNNKRRSVAMFKYGKSTDINNIHQTSDIDNISDKEFFDNMKRIRYYALKYIKWDISKRIL